MKIKNKLLLITLLFSLGKIVASEQDPLNKDQNIDTKLLELLQSYSELPLINPSDCISTTPKSKKSLSSSLADYRNITTFLPINDYQDEDSTKKLGIKPIELIQLQAAAQKAIEQKKTQLKTEKGNRGIRLEKVECPVCEKKIHSLSLVRHQKIHLSDDTKAQIKKAARFKCNYFGCKKSFAEKHLFKQHIKIHYKPHKCTWPNCNESFSRNNLLESHQSTHTGIYKLHCKTCKKGFSQEASLNQHAKRCGGKQ